MQSHQRFDGFVASMSLVAGNDKQSKVSKPGMLIVSSNHLHDDHNHSHGENAATGQSTRHEPSACCGVLFFPRMLYPSPPRPKDAYHNCDDEISKPNNQIHGDASAGLDACMTWRCPKVAYLYEAPDNGQECLKCISVSQASCDNICREHTGPTTKEKPSMLPFAAATATSSVARRLNTTATQRRLNFKGALRFLLSAAASWSGV